MRCMWSHTENYGSCGNQDGNGTWKDCYAKNVLNKKEEDHGKKEELLFFMWRKNGFDQVQSKRTVGR